MIFNARSYCCVHRLVKLGCSSNLDAALLVPHCFLGGANVLLRWWLYRFHMDVSETCVLREWTDDIWWSEGSCISGHAFSLDKDMGVALRKGIFDLSAFENLERALVVRRALLIGLYRVRSLRVCTYMVQNPASLGRYSRGQVRGILLDRSLSADAGKGVSAGRCIDLLEGQMHEWLLLE